MNKKTYLMLGGTFLPAFIAVGAVSVFTKSSVNMKSAKFLLTFAIASAVGGFITAKMIKDINFKTE